MTITRIIFERGLELSRARNSVRLATDGLTLVQVFAEMRERYGVRPVLLTETIPTFGDVTQERHAVLTLDGLERLDLRIPLLVSRGLLESQYVTLFRPAMDVRYIAGALLYHCQELALHYSHICDEAVGIREMKPIEGKFFSFGSRSEPYYEIEALITAARRTYDALRYILWQVFGPGGKNTPSNFRKTLAICEEIPAPLRSLLESSWASYGVKLTAYRDCIQHYVPVTFHGQTASMERVARGIWSVRLRLPDNPEEKSQQAYRFSHNMDALTYGWELANEVINVAAEIFASIPTECRSSGS